MIIFDNSAITYYHQAIFTIKQFSCSWSIFLFVCLRLLLTKSHIQIELVKHLQMISIPIEYILKLAILISECLQQSLLLRYVVYERCNKVIKNCMFGELITRVCVSSCREMICALFFFVIGMKLYIFILIFLILNL